VTADGSDGGDGKGTDYRAVFELANDAILIFEPATEVVLNANARYCELHGWEPDELIGSSLLGMTKDVEKGRQAIARVLEEGSTDFFETVHIGKDGTEVFLESNAVLIEYDGKPAILATSRNISARKRLEQELVQAQKMEAIGQLAGGIAHDFSNLLTAIIGSAELMRDIDGLPTEARECVEDVLASAERGSRLTRELLAFGRKQATQPEPVNINKRIEEVARWLSRLLDDSVVIRLALARDVGAVYADPVQLEQIVLNLAVNARDAMPDGGTLTIETANVELGEKLVRLSVRDTGVGMDKATIDNAFTPFFTTKPKGKGTGLGLATVYGIVKQNGGKVHIDSVLGAGSTVHVFLPHLDVDVESIRPPPPRSVQPGHESVLVVEDDKGVRSTVRRILRAAGYDVVVAASADAAFDLFGQLRGAFDAVITDVQMPGMNGVELAVSLRKLRPDLPIVLMSGHFDATSVGDCEDVEFVPKPFKPSDLTSALRRALDG